MSDHSEYIAALLREAAGYRVRGNVRGIEAVNRELVAHGVKPVPLPKPTTPKRAKRTRSED